MNIEAITDFRSGMERLENERFNKFSGELDATIKSDYEKGDIRPTTAILLRDRTLPWNEQTHEARLVEGERLEGNIRKLKLLTLIAFIVAPALLAIAFAFSIPALYISAIVIGTIAFTLFASRVYLSCCHESMKEHAKVEFAPQKIRRFIAEVFAESLLPQPIRVILAKAKENNNHSSNGSSSLSNCAIAHAPFDAYSISDLHRIARTEVITMWREGGAKEYLALIEVLLDEANEVNTPDPADMHVAHIQNADTWRFEHWKFNKEIEKMRVLLQIFNMSDRTIETLEALVKGGYDLEGLLKSDHDSDVDSDSDVDADNVSDSDDEEHQKELDSQCITAAATVAV